MDLLATYADDPEAARQLFYEIVPMKEFHEKVAGGIDAKGLHISRKGTISLWETIDENYMIFRCDLCHENVPFKMHDKDGEPVERTVLLRLENYSHYDSVDFCPGCLLLLADETPATVKPAK